MSAHATLVKIYGNISPADAALADALTKATGTALPAPDEAIVTREGDLVCLSFEGLYFPLEDALAALRQHLAPQHAGKIDYIDIEAWMLTRHTIENGALHIRSAPLNSVLDYSAK